MGEVGSYEADLALCRDAANIDVLQRGDWRYLKYETYEQAIEFILTARERWPLAINHIAALEAENRRLRRELEELKRHAVEAVRAGGAIRRLVDEALRGVEEA